MIIFKNLRNLQQEQIITLYNKETMSILRPKPPAIPPMPIAPKPPPTVAEDLPDATQENIEKLLKLKKKGFTETILTSNQGDTSEAETYQTTLLGS